MSEDIVPEGGEYDYPDAYLERLREYDTNSSEYNDVQRALYTWLGKDTRVSKKEAMNVSQLLNQGEVADAEQLVEEVLEE